MFTIFSLLLVIVVAGTWLRFGLWSGFLHMLCVLIAGALAFALWETVALLLLGTGTDWIVDSAWALGLVLPFVFILLAIRIACDKLVPANLKVPGAANLVGGGVCGFISGTISIGILIIALGYLRLEPNFMGYAPVDYSNNGSFKQNDSLIWPADRVTAGLYGKLSEGAFRPSGSNDTLARWRPEIVNTGGLLRNNFEEGSSRNTITPGGFEFVGRYRFESATFKDLVTDGVDPNDIVRAKGEEQKYTLLDGTAVTDGTIEGFIIKFKAGAKEASGRIVIGSGQVQLVVQASESDPSSTIALQPLAVISQASGDKPTLGRWRYNSANTFISTPSGRDESPMAFEFLVPKGAKPIGLYIKNIRQDLSQSKPGTTFKSQKERDAAVISGSIMSDGAGSSSASAGALDRKSVAVFNSQKWTGEPLLTLRDGLPFGVALQKDIMKGLIANDANMLTGGGLGKFSQADLKTQGLDQKLLVRRFDQPEDASIVHVVVDQRNTSFGFLSAATVGVDWDKAPLLVDNNNATYSAVGYGYRPNAQETWIYYDPSAPIRSRNDRDMPTISRSQPDQQLILIFRVSKGVKIKSFAIGEKVVADFLPVVDVPK